jgi:Right handed beta helix region
MLRTHTIAFFLAAVVVSAITATQAHAAQRTFVSAAIGNDANSATGCTVTAPCRFFQAAVAATDASGEVIVLDSGEYGGVVITQSVSLIAPTGVFAGISISNGANAVVIATPGVNVILRGLNINGGGNGIRMVAGNKLTVKSCVISNMGASGIRVTGPTTVRVVDTIIRDNGSFGILLEDGALGTITRAVVSGSTSVGVVARGQLAGTMTSADIADSVMDKNLSGVVATSDNATAIVNVTIRDSSAVGNSQNGFAAVSSAFGKVSLTASNNIVSNNGVGIQAGFGGTSVVASGNTVSGNSVAGLQNIVGGSLGNAFFTTGADNAVRNNSVDISGTVGSSTPR